MIRFAENLNKMIAAGLGGALEAPSTEVAVGHCIRHLKSSGAVASFKTNIAAPIRSLRVDMQPIQAGSGDPSPDNIRPITGRDGVTVTRSGANIFDPSTATDGKYYNGSLLEITRSDVGHSALVRMKPSTSYCMTGYAGVSIFSVLALDVNKNAITWYGAASKTDPFVFTTPANCAYAYIQYLVSQKDTIAVYESSVVGEYIAPDIQTVTVQLGQTVYGGTLDVSTGKLTVTHGEIASYNGEVLTGEWISDRDVYEAGTTPTIGAQVVYVLDTPQTIDLDPQQITTLIGDNNVWTDAGDVTLEYPYYEETEGY